MFILITYLRLQDGFNICIGSHFIDLSYNLLLTLVDPIFMWPVNVCIPIDSSRPFNLLDDRHRTCWLKDSLFTLLLSLSWFTSCFLIVHGRYNRSHLLNAFLSFPTRLCESKLFKRIAKRRLHLGHHGPLALEFGTCPIETQFLCLALGSVTIPRDAASRLVHHIVEVGSVVIAFEGMLDLVFNIIRYVTVIFAASL